MDLGFAIMPNGLLFGIEYYPVDDEQNYSELNIYIIFIVLHIRIYI